MAKKKKFHKYKRFADQGLNEIFDIIYYSDRINDASFQVLYDVFLDIDNCRLSIKDKIDSALSIINYLKENNILNNNYFIILFTYLIENGMIKK